MKTLTRKISIIVVAILAMVFMTTGVVLSVKTAKASTGTFTVTGGELLFREAHAMRTEYLINIDADSDVFADFNNGDEITNAEGFSTIGTHIEHNQDYYGNVVTLPAVTLGYTAYKYDVNVLKIVIGIPSGYAKLTFNEGLTLGGYSLESKQVLYLNEWGVFTEIEEDYRPISVYEGPDASNYLKLVLTTNNYAWFGDSAVMPTFTNVLYNGVAVANESGYPSSPCVSLGTDWNNGTGAYQSYIYFDASEYAKLSANGGVLVVKEGLQNSIGDTTTETYGFAIESGRTHADVSWANLPSWKPIKGFANLTITPGENNVYTLSLMDTKDLLKESTTADLISNFNKGDDMTDFMKKFSSLYSQMSINWQKLSEMDGVSFEKGDANQILMKLPVVATTMFLPANSIVGNAFIGNAIETDVEKEEITIAGVYQTHADGYNNMQNQTSFRVKFDGFYSNAISKVVGENVTAYFKSTKFTDYVLINGSTLTSILAQPYRTLNVYYGVRDKSDSYPGVYDYQTGDVSDSLEFVLDGMQLFDFDVTIKEGCSFADLIVASSDVTYRKQLDDTFAEYQQEEEVKAISVRETPYGDKTYRAIYVVFNSKANSADILAAAGKIFFSTNVTADPSSSYFSPEPEYGGRYYRMLVNASEYQAFITSENPTITVESFDVGDYLTSTKTTLVLKNGLFVDKNEQVELVEPTVEEVAHPGNQENDLKLFRIKFNTSVNFHIIGDFLKDNLYMNGKKVFDYTVAAGYANPEYQWDCKVFSVYIDDNIRNYDGGIDVLCIKKGIPLGGGKTTTEDIYFYGVKNIEERDGAWNWKWTFGAEVPDLKILSGGQVSVSGTDISVTINFDRITNKDDSSLTPEYKSYLDGASVMTKIKVNGKSLNQYAGADIAFTENGLTITAKKAEIGDYMKVELVEGFTVPNSYVVGESCSIEYGVNEGIWAKTFEKTNSLGFTVNDVKEISAVKTIRVGGTASQPIVGKRIAITFNDKIIGKQARTGTREDYGDANKIQWLKNITAPYADLMAMTEKSYAGLLDYVGYEYTPEIMDRFVALGIRDSILDGITINGLTLRELAELDADAYVQYTVYPISVDYKDGDTLYITIRPESSVYNDITQGVRLGVNKRIIFETETRTSKSADFMLMEDGWEEGVAYVNGITVRNTKNTYYVGQDLDLSMIIAYEIMSDDSQGEKITVAEDMISGYDKTKAGKQTVTVTYQGFSDTFEVNVIESPTTPNNPDTPSENNGCQGCNGSLSGHLIVSLVSIIATFAIIVKLRKKEN